MMLRERSVQMTRKESRKSQHRKRSAFGKLSNARIADICYTRRNGANMVDIIPVWQPLNWRKEWNRCKVITGGNNRGGKYHHFLEEFPTCRWVDLTLSSTLQYSTPQEIASSTSSVNSFEMARRYHTIGVSMAATWLRICTRMERQ